MCWNKDMEEPECWKVFPNDPKLWCEDCINRAVMQMEAAFEGGR